MRDMRTGIGYDSHRFAENRGLVIGGVTVPYEKGLAGHSDADVLVHAVIDALMGAANLGDIGKVFPDNDGRFKDISSLLRLKRTAEMLDLKGYRVVNVDSVVVMQEPRIGKFTPQMAENIASALGIESSRVCVKGKTDEGMGFVGRVEGVKAFASVLLEESGE